MDGDAAAALALLASFVGLVWGVVCLISPSSAKLPSRWYSLPLMTSLLLFFGLAMIAFPEAAGDSGQEGSAQGAGVFSIFLWALLATLAHLAARQVRLVRAKQTDSEPPATNIPPAAQTPQPEEEIAGREVQAHRRMTAALNDAKAKRHAPASVQPTIVPDRSGIPKAKAGKWIEFTYADEYGEVTDRHLRNWSRTSRYLEGFCTDRRAVRTFRLDRVIHWGDSG